MVVTFEDIISSLSSNYDDSETEIWLGFIVRQWMIGHGTNIKRILHWIPYVTPQHFINDLMTEGIQHLESIADMEERLAKEDDLS